MTDHPAGGRAHDPGLKWILGAGIASLGVLTLFLAALADELRFTGPSGAAGTTILGVAGAAGFVALAFGPVGRAMARRIFNADSVVSPQLEQDVQELRLQADDLRHALTEAHERLDFTERLLASGNDRGEKART